MYQLPKCPYSHFLQALINLSLNLLEDSYFRASILEL